MEAWAPRPEAPSLQALGPGAYASVGPRLDLKNGQGPKRAQAQVGQGWSQQAADKDNLLDKHEIGRAMTPKQSLIQCPPPTHTHTSAMGVSTLPICVCPLCCCLMNMCLVRLYVATHVFVSSEFVS